MRAHDERAGSALDKGRQWTMAIDPVNSSVLYANSGYGPAGLYKSTNGGVDWTQILPPSIMSVFDAGGFARREDEAHLAARELDDA